MILSFNAGRKEQPVAGKYPPTECYKKGMGAKNTDAGAE